MTLTQSAQSVLARGGTIVTANARAARHLHRVNQHYQSSAGNHTWLSPHILPWEAWLEEAWQALVVRGYEDRLLLSSLASDEIWFRVLKENGAEAQVLTVRGLAQTASDAWGLLCTYGHPGDLQRFSGSGDSRAFASWAARFLRLCEQRKWVDPARLPEATGYGIANGQLSLPPALLFCGFDRVHPALQGIVTSLRERGCDVQIENFASSSAHSTALNPTFVEATTTGEELQTIATWARDAINENPAVRINVIVPDLASRRDEIDQAFRPVLAPETSGILAGDTASPYEFSLGHPLSQFPIIRSALLLLRWAGSPIPLDDISWLFNCEYCGSGDRWSRARTDADLRSRGKSLRLVADVRWAINAISRTNNGWHQKLLEMERAAGRLHLNRPSDFASFTNWIEAAEEYLAACGWPGDRALNSIEYQAQNRWQRLLLSVAHLDASLPKTTFDEALQMLLRTTQSSMFAPESQDAPIQITGAAESAGLTADAVWFAGTDEYAWPASRQPNPLLPLHLQRALKMPGADLAADLDFALNVTRRICSSAPTAFASFARRQEDAHVSASPLFSGLPWSANLRAGAMRQPAAEGNYFEAEPLLDRSHVQWKESRTAGGADVQRDQAACPFRAFASKRLNAKTLEEIEEGLGPRDRGNLVHKILQSFWSEVADHHRLVTLSEQQFLEILRRHIASALERHSAPDAWTSAFLSAESHRLEKLLIDWLKIERERTPFTVLQQEQGTEQRIGPLKLHLRMDRVDQTANGKLILDYKTGKASIRDWEGERPDQPQLPLYALNTAPLAGLGFACITAKKMSIDGLQREEGTFFPSEHELGGKMTDPLDERVRIWHAVLTNLAQEFVAGEARVSPKRGLTTCRNCGLETLCRIAEAGFAIADEEGG